MSSASPSSRSDRVVQVDSGWMMRPGAAGGHQLVAHLAREGMSACHPSCTWPIERPLT